MFRSYIFFPSLYLGWTVCQLTINVKNMGGEVYQETIETNTSYDTISLDFMAPDGTLVNHFIDAKNELQIFKVSILPEDDMNQFGVLNLCFVLRFTKNEFISSDAMSKLRQKNPSAIRHPEEQAPNDTFMMDVLLNIQSTNILSPHIQSICSNAQYSTFSIQSDLKLISQILNKNYSSVEPCISRLPELEANLSCDHTTDIRLPCMCQYVVCIEWYPYGLKYCKGKDSSNRVLNYRCGIKTCRKCRYFNFYVSSPLMCPWNQHDLNNYV